LRSVVTNQLTAVQKSSRSDQRQSVDQSTTVQITAYDVGEAFAKARLWQQRQELLND
jgi:hypothetical protein